MKKRKQKTPIGDALMGFLIESGMNQSTMAKVLDVHRSTLSLWINGKRKPARGQLPQLSKLTGIPVERLL